MQLRSATRDDSALILSLIRELAEFEHLLHEVAADEATLAEHLFGAQPRSTAIRASCCMMRRP